MPPGKEMPRLDEAGDEATAERLLGGKVPAAIGAARCFFRIDVRAFDQFGKAALFKAQTMVDIGDHFLQTRRQLPNGPSRWRSFIIRRPWINSAASRVNQRFALGNAAMIVTPAEATRVLPRNHISRPCCWRSRRTFFGEPTADLGVAAIGEKLDENGAVDLQDRQQLVKEARDHRMADRSRQAHSGAREPGADLPRDRCVDDRHRISRHSGHVGRLFLRRRGRGDADDFTRRLWLARIFRR